jgi:hypothetical protein
VWLDGLMISDQALISINENKRLSSYTTNLAMHNNNRGLYLVAKMSRAQVPITPTFSQLTHYKTHYKPRSTPNIKKTKNKPQ